MDYYTDDRVHLPISKIGFGGASLSGEGKGYGFGHMSESDSQALIESAVEAGITLFDAAPIYGHHLCEKRLGKYLGDIREKVLLVSKSGVTWHENGRVNMTNDPKTTQKMLEQSLKSFNSDYIDIYMVHWPDQKIDIRYPLEVLQKAMDKGKIKYIGLCNSNTTDILKAKEVCEINFLQNECNLFNNGFNEIEDDLLADKIKMGWGTLDKGILCGHLKQVQNFDTSDCRSWAPWWKKSNWKQKLKQVQSYTDQKTELSIKELAFMYSYKHTDISLCGFKRDEHIRDAQLMLKHKDFDLLTKYFDLFERLG